MEKGRRETLLIAPYKQLRFGLMFLCLNFVFAVSAFLVFFYYLWDIYQAMLAHFELTDVEKLTTVVKLMKPLGLFGGLLVLFIIFTLWLSVRYTHQFYGPLVSIRRYLDQLIGGDSPKPIHLRKNDQLKDIVEKLNEYAAKMKKPTRKD